MRTIKFFDTTLRDGEQAPGFSMKMDDKIELALNLEKLGVDIIEAGFPITSPGDFESVKRVSAVIQNASVAGLSRANRKDIEVAWEALKGAKDPRIHTVIATSDIHLEHKLRKTRDEVLDLAVDAVKFARNLCGNVEFSAEDATRSDKDYLCRIVEATIKAGATTVNIPDTVGYTTPYEFEELISYIMNNVPNIDKATISVHCHDDLGMGVANSLAAIKAGAGQVECTINGIGERAGNAALEEIVMMLKVRNDFFDKLHTNINSRELYKASRMLSSITGIDVQPNKAIVGKNAFSHESGIHQDGVLKHALTYEIMTPESVGFPQNKIVLGKHSGRHALSSRLKDLGYDLDADTITKLFEDFKILADKKKEVHDEDLEALIYNETKIDQEHFKLDYVGFSSGNQQIPTATLTLIDKDGNSITDSSTGDGPVDAAFKTVERISGINGSLKSYKIGAITAGKDAQGEALISVVFNGSSEQISGRGYSTDVLVASVNAYISALNRYLARKNHNEKG